MLLDFTILLQHPLFHLKAATMAQRELKVKTTKKAESQSLHSTELLLTLVQGFCWLQESLNLDPSISSWMNANTFYYEQKTASLEKDQLSYAKCIKIILSFRILLAAVFFN